MTVQMQVDEVLLEQAIVAGGHRSREEALTEALKQYIQRRDQSQIVELFGKVEYDEDYDYKRQRALE